MRLLTAMMVTFFLGSLILLGGCGDDSTSPVNRPPGTGLVAYPDTVDPTGRSSITSTATDPDGDDLTYAWSSEAGAVSGTGAAITWTAPLASGSYRVYVTVEDTDGHAVSDTITVEVREGTLLVESWGGLMAVGMDASKFALCSGYTLVEVLGTRIFVDANNVTEIDYACNAIGGPGTPDKVTRVTDFTILPDGGVAFAENETDSVFFVSPQGAFIDAVQLPEASGLSQRMSGIVVGDDLIISETGSRKLARINLTTRVASIFKDLSHLSGWLIDIEYADGKYYLTQWESLYEFTETGDVTEIAHFDDGFILGVAIVGTSAFVADRGLGTIYRVDIPTGTVEVFAEGLDNPNEIEYLPAGLTAR
jgi:hypothetical protein